MNRELKRIY